MPPRSWPSWVGAALAIGWLAGGCVTPTTPAPPPPERAVQIRTIVIAWLDCDECVDGELAAVVKVGDAAVPSLAAALREGLAPGRLEGLRRHLEESYTRLGDKSAKSRASKDVYVQRYTDNLLALHQVRAAIALSSIGGPDARRALEDAQNAPYRDDVKQSIKAALARLAKP